MAAIGGQATYYSEGRAFDRRLYWSEITGLKGWSRGLERVRGIRANQDMIYKDTFYKSLGWMASSKNIPTR